MKVQDRIQELLDERGWTKYRLAKEADLSGTTITNIFKRENAPTLPTLTAVCKAFDITLSEFFSDGKSQLLTDEQRELFSTWKPLSEKQKQLLIDLMHTM